MQMITVCQNYTDRFSKLVY